MSFLINGIRGFCMALADSVPGVSGGTIAFILGFYDKFINSLDDLAYGDREKKKKALFFLFKIILGWLVGMVLAVLILTSLFEKHIYAVSSVFIGFIVFSIPLIVKEEKKTLKGKYQNLIFTLLGIIAVVLITYLNPVTGDANAVDVSKLSMGLGFYVFVVAMIAISAMVLPGISGSTLLLIFGLYVPIISAIKELLHLNFDYLPVLIVFGLGVLTGILMVVRFIKLALKKYRSQSIYCILGLMVGSIYAIIMGPTTLSVPQEALSFSTFSILFFLIGGLVIIGLEQLKKILEKKKED
ncbi:uncharacterized protein BN778_00483 [Mycoplasma sp. CAG:776]|nr:uncharacterized protein BN778_00483 [Mycoplasma sp. CAG:776]